MYQDNIVLCGASSYEQKYYFNQDFASLPETVKQELQIMCVLFTEDVGGILTLEFDEDGISDDEYDMDGELVMLGDIVISKEKVLSQAEEYGHLPKREYAFLIAHSMLHLFGYDHMVDEERVVMEAKQKEIMEKVGIFR